MGRDDNRKDVYAFDVENDGKKITLGSIVGENYEFIFNTAQEFLEEIKHRRFRTGIIFATNLGYDMGMIFNNDPEIEKVTNILRRGGRMIAARIPTGNKRCVLFADTLNFAPLSVEKLGKYIGLPKMVSPKNWRPKTSDEWQYLKEYNLNDSRITQKFMTQFHKNIGSLGITCKITTSSNAVSLWNKKYYTEKLEPSMYQHEEHESYFGGRCETFQRGEFEKIKIYDVRSMYPSIMKNLEMPIAKTAKWGVDKKLEYEGISLVDVDSPANQHIPLLPYRADKLYFPTGKWQGWYNHAELRKARELGYGIRVIKSLKYETYPAFKEFITDLYAKRHHYQTLKDDLMDYAIKLLMNGLSGKFAIKPTIEESKHESLMTKDELIEFLENGGKLANGYAHYEAPMKHVPKYSMPIVSSSITSYARVKLYECFEKTGIYNVLYCDTDSIFTLGHLPEGDYLGELEKQYEGTALIVRPKCYMTEKNIKVKGLGRVIKDKDMFIKHVIEGQPVHYERFAQIKESRRRGFYYGQIIDCVKELGVEDTKRKWKLPFSVEAQCSSPLFVKEGMIQHVYEKIMEKVREDSRLAVVKAECDFRSSDLFDLGAAGFDDPDGKLLYDSEKDAYKYE